MGKAEHRDHVLIEEVKEVGAQNRRAPVVQDKAGHQGASTCWRPLFALEWCRLPPKGKGTPLKGLRKVT